MLNGTTNTFYTTKLVGHDSSDLVFQFFFGMYFTLHHEYIQYDQYVDYRNSPTSRRLNNEESNKNDDIMPAYYFVFYIMAQFGGLYVFLHLVFGLFMNRWTEQHFKQALVNELHSSIEAKNRLRNQALSDQAERNKTSKVFPIKNKSNLGLRKHHNSEQNPLINEQSMNMRNKVNLNQQNIDLNHKNRDQQSQVNRSENPSANGMNKKSKSFYHYMDALYGIICC